MRKIMLFITILVLYFIIVISAFCEEITGDASATGLSRAFNPAISVNALFYGMSSSRDNPFWEELNLSTGLHMQELCVEMTANADIYLKAQVALSASETDSFEVEEAFVTTLRLPIPVTIRGGKMLNTFGRHNLYHLHHMAFAEPPMISSQVFGDNLDEISIEASYLVPLPWYMDMTAGVLNGDNPVLFDSDDPDQLAGLFHLDNLWDLNDEMTVRIGCSYLRGEKGFSSVDGTEFSDDLDRIVSAVWGVDWHFKWQPLQYGRYRSFTFQGEYIQAALDLDDDMTDPLHGFFVQVLGQFKLKWWLQARYDWFSRPTDLHPFFPEPENLDYNINDDLSGKRYSFAMAYVPTEFSAYRFQYNRIDLDNETEDQFIAQVNVTIGSHPAHKY